MKTGVKAEKNGNRFQTVLRGAGILAALNLCYLLFMVIVFALPIGVRVRGNATESMHVWKEGLETEAPVFNDNRVFWNDTNAEILHVNCAVTEEGPPLKRGLALYYTQVPDAEEIQPVKSYRNLEAALSETQRADVTIGTYERYWHLQTGYLRLLLSFLTIGEIRWLFYAFGSMLALWLFLRVHTLLGIKGVLPLAVAFLSRVLVLQTATLMTSTDAYVAFAAMIALTYLYRKPWFANNRALLYLVTGSVTFAIGSLIAPVLSLGMMLILDLQLENARDNVKDSWVKLVACSATWVAGYALSMLCKAVVSLLAAGSADAASVAAGYMDANGGGIAGRFNVLRSCFYRLCLPAQSTAVVLLVFAVLLILALRRSGIQKPQGLLLTLSVALYPVVWVLVVAEHSRHDYAVNIFAVTVYGLAVICAGLVKEQDGAMERAKRIPERKDV